MKDGQKDTGHRGRKWRAKTQEIFRRGGPDSKGSCDRSKMIRVMVCLQRLGLKSYSKARNVTGND